MLLSCYNILFVGYVENIIWKDEISSIKTEVAKLVSSGINKIIVLGHGGVDLDQKIAAEVPDVDIVIGGHTHTFLYTGA